MPATVRLVPAHFSMTDDRKLVRHHVPPRSFALISCRVQDPGVYDAGFTGPGFRGLVLIRS